MSLSTRLHHCTQETHPSHGHHIRPGKAAEGCSPCHPDSRRDHRSEWAQRSVVAHTDTMSSRQQTDPGAQFQHWLLGLLMTAALLTLLAAPKPDCSTTPTTPGITAPVDAMHKADTDFSAPRAMSVAAAHPAAAAILDTVADAGCHADDVSRVPITLPAYCPGAAATGIHDRPGCRSSIHDFVSPSPSGPPAPASIAARSVLRL